MQARAERENEEKAKRAKRIEEMTEEFDRASTQMVSSVAEGATELKSVASSMSGVANRTEEKSVTVAAAAVQASANVSTVASATEEINASLAELASQVSRDTEVARSDLTRLVWGRRV